MSIGVPGNLKEGVDDVAYGECMSRRKAIWSVVTVLLLVLGMSGCGSNEAKLNDTKAASSSDASNAASKQLPDLVGKGLQYAQDTAQAAGFRSLTSHDASGRGRHQILDRDWQVCFQDPAAGAVSTSTKIDFGVVKTDEKCPSADTKDATAGDAGASTMPNVVGTSVTAAEKTLGSNASVTLTDGTGQKRTVVIMSNWQVCSQTPAAGASYVGVPVTLTVVKYGESC
jgi:beta-lactam-binding protein with PASTA domain